jgi:hypothetical protein
MAYMLIGIVTAVYMALTTFMSTGSILLSFAIYSLTGTLVLCNAVASEALFGRDSDDVRRLD